MTGERVEGDLALSRQAWADYQYWVRTDRNAAQRIARLTEDCLRDPFHGVGNPEPLRHDLAGLWSRRITKEHRLVYKFEDERCVIVQCRYHY